MNTIKNRSGKIDIVELFLDQLEDEHMRREGWFISRSGATFAEAAGMTHDPKTDPLGYDIREGIWADAELDPRVHAERVKEEDIAFDMGDFSDLNEAGSYFPGFNANWSEVGPGSIDSPAYIDRLRAAQKPSTASIHPYLRKVGWRVPLVKEDVEASKPAKVPVASKASVAPRPAPTLMPKPAPAVAKPAPKQEQEAEAAPLKPVPCLNPGCNATVLSGRGYCGKDGGELRYKAEKARGLHRPAPKVVITTGASANKSLHPAAALRTRRYERGARPLAARR